MNAEKCKRLFVDSPVAFDCNDYRNGNSQGFFEQVRIDRAQIQLDGPQTRIAFVRPGVVRIGRRQFAFTQWSNWVGNWCWDELTFPRVGPLLRYLRSKGFVCHEAPTAFFEAFNRITPAPTPGEPA